MSPTTAVIIGAGSGIGAAVARQLGEAGHRLLLADRDLGRVSALAAQLACDAAEVDLCDEASIRELARRCTNGVDALVITAGISMSMGSFDQVMAVNLAGTARALEQFGGHMNTGSAAVCLGSIAGHLLPPPGDAVTAILDRPLDDVAAKLRRQLPADACSAGMAYGLSKLGVIRLAKRTGVAWGPRGVRVCSVSPGPIETPMGSLEMAQSPQARDALGSAPIARQGSPDEVAQVIAFLCSPKASFVTCCDILVDGGWVGAAQAGDASPLAQAIQASRGRA